jgi:hypothetical protein
MTRIGSRFFEIRRESSPSLYIKAGWMVAMWWPHDRPRWRTRWAPRVRCLVVDLHRLEVYLGPYFWPIRPRPRASRVS